MLAKIILVCCLAGFSLGNEHVLPNDDCDGFDAKSCQNFDEARQNAINTQINMELRASYIYMAMGAYFSRDEPNHVGYAKFFTESSTEEREHAMKLMEYLNSRGGEVRLTAIQAPGKHEWTHGEQALQEALALEKQVNAALLTLHAGAGNDPHLQDFLESNYLNEQVDSIRQLAGYVNQVRNLKVTNPGLGEHIFNEKLAK